MPRTVKPRTRQPADEDCQSCGMPLSRDEARPGRVAAPYCSHCYRAGRFVLPDLTVEQMQERVRRRLREVGVQPRRAAAFVRRIPSLARWKRGS